MSRAHRPRLLSRGTLLALLLLAAGHAPAQEDRGDGRVRLLVRFRAGLGTGEERLVHQEGGEVRHRFPRLGTVAVEVPATAVDALRRDPSVAFVEADPWRVPTALSRGELQPSASNGLYGLVLTRSLEAQERTSGGGIRLCAADTGLDARHPDIAPAYRGGIDMIDDDDDPDVGRAADEGFHGTFVDAILVAAVNGMGVRGVAPHAELYHARVLRAEGGSTSDIMAGVQHLVEERGCDVVNLSLGGSSNSSSEERFYRDLIAQHRVIIVAAAGNDGKDGLSYPAAYPGIVSVGALDSAGNYAEFSNRDAALDLSGPGVLVLSAQPRGTGSEASVTVKNRALTAIAMIHAGRTNAAGAKKRVVDCGTGNTPGEFPKSVRGAFALMRRGDEFFRVKVQNAMNAGAVGAIVYNNVETPLPVPDLVDDTAAGGKPWVPSVIVSLADGEGLRGEKKPVVLLNGPSDWGLSSGTSFASPHVAGAAALVWAAAPQLSASEVVDILRSTAQDLGDAGPDARFGAGLVDAEAAVAAALER